MVIDDSDLMRGLDRQFLGFTSPTSPRIQAGGHPCQGVDSPETAGDERPFVGLHSAVAV